MRARAIAFAWLLVGAAVWNGFFDLYVSRGARHYLQLQAEFELGRASEPSMRAAMDVATRDGLIAASLWAAAIVACGWGTLALARRKRDA